MNPANQLQLELKDGTFTINDAIKICFASATLILPQDAKSYKLKEGEIKHIITSPGPADEILVKAVKPAIKKVEKETQQKLTSDHFRRNPMVDVLLNHIKTSGPITREKLQELTKCDKKLLSNFLHTHKKLGRIILTDRSTYAISTAKLQMDEIKKAHAKITPVVKKTVIKKTTPSVKKVIPAAPINPSLVPTVEKTEIIEKKVNATEENNIHKYPSGDFILLNDQIKILPVEEANREDDILLFDEEYVGANGVVIKFDEGSNMVKVRLAPFGREMLVYPHWIRLTLRP